MNAHKTNSLIDLLRFVFALAIVVHHIEQYRASCGFVNYWENATIISFGKTSIIFFFVLSGYLVTNSFLRQATFDIKKFYKRRLLRIAPLYYILVCCSIFIFPNINLLNNAPSLADTTQNLLYFLFLPNIVLAAFPANPFLAHTWFVGTTEQYHFLSALCYKYSKSRQTYAFLLMALVAIYWAFGLYVKIFAQESFLYIFWHYFNIDCLAIGAIFALLPKEGKWISLLKTKCVFIVSTLIFIFLLISGIVIPFVYNQLLALCFGIFIYNIMQHDISFASANRVVHFLGKISYSIYMIHPIVIICTINLLQEYANATILTYGFVVLFTLLVASAYHVFIEKRITNKPFSH